MIGRSCILCANASVGASTSLGDDVILGHRAAIKDHLSIVAKSRIAAKSGVVRDITDAGDYAGHPAVKAQEFKQQVNTYPYFLGRISYSIIKKDSKPIESPSLMQGLSPFFGFLKMGLVKIHLCMICSHKLDKTT